MIGGVGDDYDVDGEGEINRIAEFEGCFLHVIFWGLQRVKVTGAEDPPRMERRNNSSNDRWRIDNNIMLLCA